MNIGNSICEMIYICIADKREEFINEKYETINIDLNLVIYQNIVPSFEATDNCMDILDIINENLVKLNKNIW